MSTSPIVIAEPEEDIEEKKVKRKGRRWNVNKMGSVIYKGHECYSIMNSIQLSISVQVGHITPIPPRKLMEEDFRISVKLDFPRSGSPKTPPHHQRDFLSKDYCPMVFRKLRERFGIDASEYMTSICGDEALSMSGSPGKSLSLFFFSSDMKYILKTINQKECHYLKEILPHYYNHVMLNPNTFLPRFFGMHLLKIRGGSNVRFIVMANVFMTELKIHVKFDLKGSTHGRKTKVKPEEPFVVGKIYKDLDIYEKSVLVGPTRKTMIMEQLKADLKFLSQRESMDYSLLLGLHRKNLSRHEVENGIVEVNETDYSSRRLPSSPKSSISSSTTSFVSTTDGSGNVIAVVPQSDVTTMQNIAVQTPMESANHIQIGVTADPHNPTVNSVLGISNTSGTTTSSPVAIDNVHITVSTQNNNTVSPRFKHKFQGIGNTNFAGEMLPETRYLDIAESDPGSVMTAYSEVTSVDDTMTYGEYERRIAQSQMGQDSAYTLSPHNSLRSVVSSSNIHTDNKMQRFQVEDAEVGSSISEFQRDNGGQSSTHNEEIYFIGIIDILQKWNTKKKAENFFKSIFNDGQKISAVAPPKYAERFLKFVETVFQ